jgi:hypothetical protein
MDHVTKLWGALSGVMIGYAELNAAGAQVDNLGT